MYSSVQERLIHLHHCRSVGWKTIDRLLRIDPSLSSIFSLPYSALASMLSISREQYSLFFQDLHSFAIQSMIKTYKDKNIHIITVFDDYYPKWLKHIFEPPWVLYAKGNIAWLSFPKMISIVGTRQPTNEGIRALRTLLPPLIEEGWLIVSGLALGIDAAAHEIAIEHKGKTIAVIAGGIGHIYPKQNRGLAERLMRDHLIISEYPPHTKPQKWQFPLRNRIISGLSLGTVVIQAKEKSGSLITASLALEQGRDVFAVPGSIFLEQASGTNYLIQQGAKLVRSAQDIIDEFTYLFPDG
ncbi:DNA processing protein [Anoxybacillus tepidamans]|uniref:DNA processing protein n=1 Tax=Anoxybacteroides tepidamans TaxID=265948 RepID=A0A7W8IND7_9BACL|nr:DNA-processing protein DprA [Anoxybacillus tepidamans]MBB5323687.1 DNA processing protein [Anoxybacillus tepidamans]